GQLLDLATHGAERAGRHPGLLVHPVGRGSELLGRLRGDPEGRSALLHPTAKILRGPGRLLRRVQYAFDRCSVRSVGLGHIAHSGTERARRTGRFARSLDELADVGCDTRLSLEASSHPDLLSFALLLEQVLAAGQVAVEDSVRNNVLGFTRCCDAVFLLLLGLPVLLQFCTPVADSALQLELERVVRAVADPDRSVALVAGL